jgi:hypothetical protein
LEKAGADVLGFLAKRFQGKLQIDKSESKLKKLLRRLKHWSIKEAKFYKNLSLKDLEVIVF